MGKPRNTIRVEKCYNHPSLKKAVKCDKCRDILLLSHTGNTVCKILEKRLQSITEPHLNEILMRNEETKKG